MTVVIEPPSPLDPNPFANALSNVEAVATQLFDSDPRIQSVGVGIDENGGPAYRAVRNIKKIVAFEAATHRLSTPYPVVFVDAEQDVVPLLRNPHGGAVVAAAGSVIPEQQRHRPICCGLQIQNFDDDQREGVLAQGLMTVGNDRLLREEERRRAIHPVEQSRCRGREPWRDRRQDPAARGDNIRR